MRGAVRPANPAGLAARSAVPAVTDPRAAQVRRYEGGQLVWRVQCGDMINRERCVTVLVQDDQVVLVGPPGETARLTAGQLDQVAPLQGTVLGLAGGARASGCRRARPAAGPAPRVAPEAGVAAEPVAQLRGDRTARAYPAGRDPLTARGLIEKSTVNP